MAVTNTAAFGQSGFFYQCKVTAAKAAIGTATNTNTVALVAAGNIGANGTIVTGISCVPANTITASWVAIYWSTDSGTTLTPLTVGTLTAYTAAATSGPTPFSFLHPNGTAIGPTNPLYLPYAAGNAIYAGIGVAVTDGVLFQINGTNL